MDLNHRPPGLRNQRFPRNQSLANFNFMGPTSTPDCSIPLSIYWNKSTFKDYPLSYFMKREKWTIPDTLTLARVILTVVIVYLIFTGFGVILIASLFVIAMLTDFFDGKIARKFNQETEFGRKFDIVADRILMTGVALAIILSLGSNEIFGRFEILQVFLIMSREIISLPFATMIVISRKEFPKTRFIGKITTFLQGVSFPIIILSAFYSGFGFSIFLVILTSVVGAISAFICINDSYNIGVKK